MFIWAGRVAWRLEMWNGYKILFGKFKHKIPLGKFIPSWGHNIELDLNEIRCEGMDWIHLVHIRVQCLNFGNTVMNLRVPWDKVVNFLDYLSNYKFFHEHPVPWNCFRYPSFSAVWLKSHSKRKSFTYLLKGNRYFKDIRDVTKRVICSHTPTWLIFTMASCWSFMLQYKNFRLFRDEATNFLANIFDLYNVSIFMLSLSSVN
jgi:hypothetical protein